MSRNRSPLGVDHDGFPRVSGDEPKPVASVTYADLFSPRERG